MLTLSRTVSRRALLGALAGAGTLLTARGGYAEALRETARTTEGPFYPDALPLDTDNDLLIVNDTITASTGRIAWLSGRILAVSGQPVRNALVEVWQCDAKGSYLHSKGRTAERDPNFQGYGRFLTGSSGEYSFRTISPVPYSFYGISRAPHIHLAVSRNGRRVLTTQVHVDGHAMNSSDGVLQRLDPAARATVITAFTPIAGSPLGEMSARWDVVLGRTALEGDDGAMRGAVGKPERPQDFWNRVKAMQGGAAKP
ncbi:MAG TPA: protocatechuate 3,4-dioxygenase [Luteitalea sp.]|nr:protocatechuate 3,4-dioxygenase [Luteitalea sp.]